MAIGKGRYKRCLLVVALELWRGGPVLMASGATRVPGVILPVYRLCGHASRLHCKVCVLFGDFSIITYTPHGWSLSRESGLLVPCRLDLPAYLVRLGLPFYPGNLIFADVPISPNRLVFSLRWQEII